MRSHPFSTAYLLVTHGSRDPRPHWATARLAQQVAARLPALSPPPQRLQPLSVVGNALQSASLARNPLNRPANEQPLVGTAVLELGAVSLPEQIQQFAQTARAAGCDRLRIMPLFLLPGVHVMEDIPAAIAEAQARIGTALSLELCPHLGSHPGMEPLAAHALTRLPNRQWIVLAHGSRRPGGNCPIEALADKLGAAPAYWSVAPDLRSQVEQLVGQGHRAIAILPYFLFEGSLMDAIAQLTQQLAQQFPGTDIRLANPLASQPQLIDLLVDFLVDR